MTTASPPLAIEQVAIDSLHPDPANPRRISEEELNALTRSIRAWGLVEPVVARREDAIVVGGHQRLVAARRAGLSTVPVVWLDISAHQAHLLGLALNRISGAWDEQLLARLVADLKAAPDIDISLTGFGDDEVKDLMRALAAAEKADRPDTLDLEHALDDAPGPRRSAPGDLWRLGEHRVLCGDATDPQNDAPLARWRSLPAAFKPAGAFPRSTIHFTGSSSVTDPVSTPADMLIHDEEDLSDPRIIAQFTSRLDHSRYGAKFRLSTPRLPGSGIDRICRRVTSATG